MSSLFDSVEADRLKEEGMARAVSPEYRRILVGNAKHVAHQIALFRGEVTIDDVHHWMTMRMLSPQFLGNGAGSIFRGKSWECVGWKKSTRISNHSRMIRIWRLKI